jgi:hypothetical protein
MSARGAHVRTVQSALASSRVGEGCGHGCRGTAARWAAWAIARFAQKIAENNAIVLTRAQSPAFNMTLLCLGSIDPRAAVSSGSYRATADRVGLIDDVSPESYYLLMVKPARPLAVDYVFPMTFFFSSGQRFLTALALIDPTASPSDQKPQGRGCSSHRTLVLISRQRGSTRARLVAPALKCLSCTPRGGGH